jgi:hypothetical protein
MTQDSANSGPAPSASKLGLLSAFAAIGNRRISGAARIEITAACIRYMGGILPNRIGAALVGVNVGAWVVVSRLWWKKERCTAPDSLDTREP